MYLRLTRSMAPALLPALGMLVLAGCSGSDPASGPSNTPSSAPTSTSTTSSAPTETPSATPPSSATPPGQQADVTINVTVANGRVNPSGSTIQAKAGQTVLVTAVSDAAEELHIHGYDKQLELSPGTPASVKFTANMKGTFEIETHKSGKLVAKLVVS
jgi:cytoskeletal protein RodZ